MSLTTDEHRLVVSIQNADTVNQLTRDYQKNETALRDLIRAGVSAAGGQAAYDAAIKASASALAANRDALTKAQGAARDFRQNITALGYAMNDFFSVSGGLSQRLGAIANNIPQLLAGFGHWGIALSAVLPIIGMLLPQLERLAKALGLEDAPKFLASNVEIIKAKLKELEGKPVKISMDLISIHEAQEALDKLQRDTNAFRQLEEMRTSRQDRSKKAVDSVLKEADAPAVAAKVKEAVAGQMIANDPAIAAARERARKAREAAEQTAADVTAEPGAADFHRQAAAEAEDEARQRAVAIRAKGGEAEAAVGAAKTEAEKGKPGQLQKQLRAAGRGDLADALGQTTPDAIKAQDEMRAKLGQDIGNLANKAARDLRERARKAREEQNATIEDANPDDLTGVDFRGQRADAWRAVNAPPKPGIGGPFVPPKEKGGAGRGRPGAPGRGVQGPMGPGMPGDVGDGFEPPAAAVPAGPAGPIRPGGNGLAVVNDRKRDRPDAQRFNPKTIEGRVERGQLRNREKAEALKHRQSLIAGKKRRTKERAQAAALAASPAAARLGGMVDRPRADFGGKPAKPPTTQQPQIAKQMADVGTAWNQAFQAQQGQINQLGAVLQNLLGPVKAMGAQQRQMMRDAQQNFNDGLPGLW